MPARGCEGFRKDPRLVARSRVRVARGMNRNGRRVPTELVGFCRNRLLNRLCRPPLLPLRPLIAEDIPEALTLASEAYSPGLQEACLRTLREHETALRSSLSDGRRLFVHRHSTQLVAVCGLHTYSWGPADISWLSWFFIAPRFQRTFFPAQVFASLIFEARRLGLRAIYVETPSPASSYSEVFSYLARVGFLHQATLPDYYEPGVDLCISKLDFRGADAP